MSLYLMWIVLIIKSYIPLSSNLVHLQQNKLDQFFKLSDALELIVLLSYVISVDYKISYIFQLSWPFLQQNKLDQFQKD